MCLTDFTYTGSIVSLGGKEVHHGTNKQLANQTDFTNSFWTQNKKIAVNAYGQQGAQSLALPDDTTALNITCLEVHTALLQLGLSDALQCIKPENRPLYLHQTGKVARVSNHDSGDELLFEFLERNTPLLKEKFGDFDVFAVSGDAPGGHHSEIFIPVHLHDDIIFAQQSLCQFSTPKKCCLKRVDHQDISRTRYLSTNEDDGQTFASSTKQLSF